MAKNQYEKAVGHDHINDKYKNVTDHGQTTSLKEKRIQELKQQIDELRQASNIEYQVQANDIETIAQKINSLADTDKLQQIKNMIN